MDDEIGVTTDSPAVTDPAADPSAGSQNTDATAGGTQPQYVPYARFQEVNGKFRQQEQLNQQQAHALQQMQQELEQMRRAATPAGAPPSPEYVQAAEALLRIMEANPKLKQLLGLADAAPQLVQGYQGVQELTQAQARSLVQSGRSQIAQLAETAGLPSGEDHLNMVEELVTAVIRRTPGAEEKFRQGDLSVVSAAFKQVQETFLNSLTRHTTAGVAQTKANVKNLPPAPRGGGLPGPKIPAKPQPGQERKFVADLHEAANALLQERMGS